MEIKSATNKSYAHVVVSAKEYAEIKAQALKGLPKTIQIAKQKIINEDKKNSVR